MRREFVQKLSVFVIVMAGTAASIFISTKLVVGVIGMCK